MDSAKKALLKKLHDDLLTDLAPYGFSLVWDQGLSEARAAYSGFGVRFKQDQHLYLRFEFDRAGLEDLIWGVRRETDAVEQDSAKWSDIHQVMAKFFGAGKESVWWPWYSNDPNGGLDVTVDIKYWQKNDGPWVMIASGDLSKKIAELAGRVFDAFRNEELIDKLM